jgi:hypothetical protein
VPRAPFANTLKAGAFPRWAFGFWHFRFMFFLEVSSFVAHTNFVGTRSSRAISLC